MYSYNMNDDTLDYEATCKANNMMNRTLENEPFYMTNHDLDQDAQRYADQSISNEDPIRIMFRYNTDHIDYEYQLTNVDLEFEEMLARYFKNRYKALVYHYESKLIQNKYPYIISLLYTDDLLLANYINQCTDSADFCNICFPIISIIEHLSKKLQLTDFVGLIEPAALYNLYIFIVEMKDEIKPEEFKVLNNANIVQKIYNYMIDKGEEAIMKMYKVRNLCGEELRTLVEDLYQSLQAMQRISDDSDK